MKKVYIVFTISYTVFKGATKLEVQYQKGQGYIKFLCANNNQRQRLLDTCPKDAIIFDSFELAKEAAGTFNAGAELGIAEISIERYKEFLYDAIRKELIYVNVFNSFF